MSRENETPSTGCFSMFIQTNPSTIYAESNLGEKLFEQVESYSARLANLMSFEGSGTDKDTIQISCQFKKCILRYKD